MYRKKKLREDKKSTTGNKSQLNDIIKANVFLKSPKKERAIKTIKPIKSAGINFLNIMKRVLFSLSYYTPYVSGLTLYVQRIARGLSRKEVEVTILTSQHDKNLPLHSGDDINVVRVPYFFKISKGFIMPLYIFAAYKAVKNSDVIFVNLPQAEGFIVSLWARFLHKKLFCIYHCDLTLPKGMMNFLINKTVIICNSITLKLSEKIIVFTKEYAETSPYIKKYKNKFIQILPPVYPLPIDEEYLTKLKNEFSAGVDFKLGFAARIAEEKGLEYLIEAIQNINNIKLFVAGPKEEVVGEQKYMKKISKILDENKGKVIPLGFLTENQMGAFYKFINLLVVPSVNRTEAFGLVQAEAMFVGCPVVATDLPGVKFLVEKTGAGKICQIKNSDDLKMKIEKIRKSYAGYKQKTNKIYDFINADTTIEKFLKLINN